mgnify:CR=1 FL=1
MLQEDFITKLIDIQDAVIENVQIGGFFIHIHLSLKRKPHVCPTCGAITQNVHDYRIQKIKDLPIQGKHVILHYRKRRYRCTCCTKKFYEDLHILPKRHRITSRTALLAVDSLRERRSIKDAANAAGVSASSVLRWLKYASFPVPKALPKVLSIDEFKGNASGEKFQCILTDLNQRQVFDILPTRKQEDLFAYFAHFRDKTNVKHIVMDMSRSYLEVARTCFPPATVVIDKRKYFKRSRRLLLARMKTLSDENKLAVERMLSYSVDLKNAYILKEYFYEFMDSKDKLQAQEKLKWFRMQARFVGLSEFERCLTMLKNWEAFILNAFDCGYSNGFTEGINNSVKVIKRVGFGYRSFDTLRTRILLIHKQTKQALRA